MHMEFRARRQDGYMWIKVFSGKSLDYELSEVGLIVLKPEEWILLEDAFLKNRANELIAVWEEKRKS